MKQGLLFLLTLSLLALFACQSAISTTKTFNKTDFVGEQIVVPASVSPNLKTIGINVLFPHGYKVLDEAQPYVKLMTGEGSLIQDHLIDQFPFEITLKKHISSSKLFVDLGIYYCREVEIAMCLRKNVLYEIPVDKDSAQTELKLNYQIKDEGY